MRSLLILGAAAYNVRVIDEVRAAGYRAVVADRDPDAPGLACADSAHIVDFGQPSAVTELARVEAVDGVMATNDLGVRSAAAATSALGLPGADPETADRSCDKGLMRERWAHHGLPQPMFRIVHTRHQAEAALAELGTPAVVKPADSGGGGRGVSVVRRAEELDWAFAFAFASARNGRVLVESFLDGTEMTIETMSAGGEVHVLACSDKIKLPLRTRVATHLRYPPALEGAGLDAVHDLARQAVKSIGLADGPGHLEVIVTDRGPQLVEFGARGGGGHIFSTVIEVVSGVAAVRQAAHVLTGGASDLRVVAHRGCVYLFFIPENGLVRAVHGVDQARALPGVVDLGITRGRGTVLGAVTDSLQRSGFAVVQGHDREQAIRRAAAVEELVRFEIEPVRVHA